MLACEFCHNKERCLRHPHDVTTILCSNCVQLFLNLIQEQLKKAHRLAIEKGYNDKAMVLEQFIEEDEQYVRETEETGRDLVRARPLPKTRSARYEIRA